MRQWLEYILVFSCLLLSLSCVRFEPQGFLFVSTDSVYMDMGHKAIYELEGNILNIGEEHIKEHGFCWAETAKPNTWDSSTELGPTDTRGSFTSIIEGVKAHTTYYVRAYVTTSNGIMYGNEKSFTASVRAIPTIQTLDPNDINLNSAVCGGDVLLEGVSAVTRRGVCWSTEELPTVSDRVAEEGEGQGVFRVPLEELDLNTIYFARAFATNSEGTAYGDEVSFKTWAEGEFDDYEGNVYPSVVIGEQTWMKKNLRVTHYTDGRPIPEVRIDWLEVPAGTRAYCWPNNDSTYADPYGALYTWSAAMDGAGSNDSNPGEVQGVCPDGWHMPSDLEWKELELFIGMDPAEVDSVGFNRNRGNGFGGRLKEVGYLHWRNPNTEATNYTGFTAVGGGLRNIDGNFRSLNRNATYWTSAEFNELSSWTRGLSYNNSNIGRDNDSKGNGASVRCIKNEIVTKSSEK